MTTMYDASRTSIARIPADAPIVAGGANWTAADFARFPNAVHVRIAQTAADVTKDVIDFEAKFLFNAAGLRQWVTGHQKLGRGLGTVYCWHGNLGMVRAALAGLNYWLWIADATGVPHSYPGANVIATQWCNYTNGPIPGVDISEVTDVAALTGGGGVPSTSGGAMWWIDAGAGTVVQGTAAQAQAHGWLGPYPTQAAAEAALGSAGGGGGGGGGSGGGSWYVITIRRTPQTPFTVEVSQKPFPSGPGITALEDSGPYATKAAAEAAAGKLRGAPIPGVVSTNPLSALGGVTAFLTHLSDGAMWRCIGWLILGVLLIIAGIYLWLKKAGVIPDAVPVPVPV